MAGLKLMSIESVMPSNHLILCRPLLLLSSIFPSISKLQIESHNLKCLFASRLPRESAPVSTEEGVRWMHQVGPSEGPLALGKQLWKPRSAALSQEALNLGLLCQDACSLLRRPSSCNAFQVCPWEPSGWSPHRTGIECLLLGGLGAMCRDGWPRYVQMGFLPSASMKGPKRPGHGHLPFS